MKAVVLAVFGMLLATGCAPKGPQDAGVPAGSDLLTDIVSPAGQRSGSATSLEVPADGAMYIFNVSENQMLYSGALKTGDVIKLSWGGVAISGLLPSKNRTKPRYDRQVARYEAGHQYRVYYKPGEAIKEKDPLEGSPLTRPFETQDRTVNPLEKKK